MWAQVARHISETTGNAFGAAHAQAVGGGCINEAYLLDDGWKKYFVKLNSPSLLRMFEAEVAGLREMISARAMRVPEPVCCGVAEGRSYLVLEHVDMGHAGDARAMGLQLAALHRRTRERFGFHCNNTIGSTPQINTWMECWVDFYREHRLGYQFELAARNGASFQGVEVLMDRLEDYFSDYTPKASLLHGDLWGGNASFDQDGNPVIYDPACYYGDREADIAFTEMFGGFGAGFYEAYHEAWALDEGYAVRKDLYNLYHQLNHFNLFGGCYARSAQACVERLLRA